MQSRTILPTTVDRRPPAYGGAQICGWVGFWAIFVGRLLLVRVAPYSLVTGRVSKDSAQVLREARHV